MPTEYATSPTPLARTPDWYTTADWDAIHYQTAIDMARSLVRRYHDPNLMGVVLATPLLHAGGRVSYSAEMVLVEHCFDPYPGSAVVLHLVGYGDDGEPHLLPQYRRTDVQALAQEMVKRG